MEQALGMESVQRLDPRQAIAPEREAGGGFGDEIGGFSGQGGVVAESGERRRDPVDQPGGESGGAEQQA